LGIFGGSQQVRGFDQTHEFVGRNHSHRSFTSAADNHDLAIIRHAVKDGGETLSQIGVCSFCQIKPF
jgi:hypothetical protein